jgi:hypothetical protein
MSLISALIQVRSTWLIQYYNAFGSKLRLQHRFTNIKNIATCILKIKQEKRKINKYYFENLNSNINGFYNNLKEIEIIESPEL